MLTLVFVSPKKLVKVRPLVSTSPSSSSVLSMITLFLCRFMAIGFKPSARISRLSRCCSWTDRNIYHLVQPISGSFLNLVDLLGWVCYSSVDELAFRSVWPIFPLSDVKNAEVIPGSTATSTSSSSFVDKSDKTSVSEEFRSFHVDSRKMFLPEQMDSIFQQLNFFSSEVFCGIFLLLALPAFFWPI